MPSDSPHLPLYNAIGGGYDSTRRADSRIADPLFKLLDPKPGVRILDLACGTGNYTVEFARRGLRMVGIDCSSKMIESARSKSPDSIWTVCDAAQLPFPSETFGGAICSLAIHHFGNISQTFREVGRVLKGGRFVIFTAAPEQMAGYWLCEYFPAIMAESARAMPPIATLRDALETAEFRFLEFVSWNIPEDPKDLFLYAGKHSPAFYLDPRNRAGISSFAKNPGHPEIATGVARLTADIASGEIERVMSRYRHSAGDYGFVVADKYSAAR